MSYNNYITGGFFNAPQQTSNVCIFKNLIKPDFSIGGQSVSRPIQCSNEKINASAILCECHLKSYFNLGIKQEIVLPNDNSAERNYYALKYAEVRDVMVSFPMQLKLKKCNAAIPENPKLDDYEFCIDRNALQSHSFNYLPPQVLATLLSNAQLSDHYTTDPTGLQAITPGVGTLYSQYLLKWSPILEKHFDDVTLYARLESDKIDEGLKKIRGEDNAHINIPMNMLPTFYKFLFAYAELSTLTSKKIEDKLVKVKPPNLILNLDTQAFEVINKSSKQKIMLYQPGGRMTLSTDVVLAGTRKVTDINKEGGMLNLSNFLPLVPVCADM